MGLPFLPAMSTNYDNSDDLTAIRVSFISGSDDFTAIFTIAQILRGLLLVLFSSNFHFSIVFPANLKNLAH